VILKLIIFGAAAYFIYKFFGGQLPTIGGKSAGKTGKKSKEEKKLDEDTLVECSKCGTYITVKESTLISGKYYCDECV